eukprot:s1822_g6.t1
MARYECQTLECPDVPGKPNANWWDYVKSDAWQKLRWVESTEKTILQQADAFPGGLPLSVDIDREVVRDDANEWGLLVTYTKNGKYLMTAYRMAGLLLFGADTVKRKLQSANLSMDGWFTGADFPQVAVDQLATAVRRRFVHANFPDRCLFSDITEFVKSADAKISKMRLVMGNHEGLSSAEKRKVEECGQSDLFVHQLSDSSARFKSIYEHNFADRLVWDPQQV